MSSQRRILSSRANGATSHGPKTPEGKSISAANAITHGLNARGIVFRSECASFYESLLEALVRKFQPRDEAEMQLVERMAIAQWKQRRATNLETAHVDVEMELQHREITRTFKTIHNSTRTALAFTGAEKRSGAISLLGTYEARANNAFRRALRDLIDARALEAASCPAQSGAPLDAAGEESSAVPSAPAAPARVSVEAPEIAKSINEPSPTSEHRDNPPAASGPAAPGQLDATTTSEPPAGPQAGENEKSINEPSPICGHRENSSPEPLDPELHRFDLA